MDRLFLQEVQSSQQRDIGFEKIGQLACKKEQVFFRYGWLEEPAEVSIFPVFFDPQREQALLRKLFQDLLAPFPHP